MKKANRNPPFSRPYSIERNLTAEKVLRLLPKLSLRLSSLAYFGIFFS